MEGKMKSLDKLTINDFAPLVDETFYLHTEQAEPISVALIKASTLGPDPAEDEANDQKPARRRPFSLIFRGPVETHLPQSIYQIRHEKLGAMGLFLVPVGLDEEGMHYEAIFT
jgi:hypothetical protein